MRKFISIFSSICLIVIGSSINFSSYSQTIKIGNQEWTNKNLNVSVFRNGDIIPQAKTKADWEKYDNDQTPAWSYYEYLTSNGTKYGKLYNWYAVNDKRGLAPLGYHIPSAQEWDVLAQFLGGYEIAGEKMKSKNSTWNKVLPAGSCGFDAVLAGKRYVGGFINEGDGAYFWSSTEYAPEYALPFSISSMDKSLKSQEAGAPSGYHQSGALSIRCLKD